MSATCPISIIVPCRNPGPQLREAMASVWAQRGVELDVVVVDGASTDGTREWLQLHRERFSTLVSEPDRGIYDAMNKGVRQARGEWVLFLGADDRLVADDTLATFRREAERSNAGVMAGEAAYSDGRVYRYTGRFTPAARNFVHHQAALYRRELFSLHGGFDTSLRVAADYDFNLRLWARGVRFNPMLLRVALCGTGGASDGGRWTAYREEIAVRHRHFASWRCWLWDLASMVRFARKQVVRGTDRSRRPSTPAQQAPGQ